MNTHQLINQAAAKLALANEEMNRSAEDVVTIAVCHNIKQCVYCLLKAYLLGKGIKSKENVPLSFLLNECKKAGNDFSKIDFSALRCRDLSVKENENLYCLNLSGVRKCLGVANEVEKAVRGNGKVKTNGSLN